MRASPETVVAGRSSTHSPRSRASLRILRAPLPPSASGSVPPPFSVPEATVGYERSVIPHGPRIPSQSAALEPPVIVGAGFSTPRRCRSLGFESSFESGYRCPTKTSLSRQKKPGVALPPPFARSVGAGSGAFLEGRSP